jgi:hypothetical protein
MFVILYKDCGFWVEFLFMWLRVTKNRSDCCVVKERRVYHVMREKEGRVSWICGVTRGKEEGYSCGMSMSRWITSLGQFTLHDDSSDNYVPLWITLFNSSTITIYVSTN